MHTFWLGCLNLEHWNPPVSLGLYLLYTAPCGNKGREGHLLSRVQLHRNQMDLYALSSIQHVFFYCMDLPVDVLYLLLLLLLSTPLIYQVAELAIFGWWFGTLGRCCRPFATQSLLSFLLRTETDCKFRMASTQP